MTDLVGAQTAASLLERRTTLEEAKIFNLDEIVERAVSEVKALDTGLDMRKLINA